MGATFYAQILRDFDWEGCRQECIHHAELFYEEYVDSGYTFAEDGEILEGPDAEVHEGPGLSDERLYGSSYLGTVMALTPSGKFWMPWSSSHLTSLEKRRDSAWFTALFHAAAKHDGWIEHGEGDPCDLFFAMNVRPSEFRKGKDDD